jgi:CBS-domain-containing membrane protein
MKSVPHQGPQHGPIFRFIAFFARLRLWYLLRGLQNRKILRVMFVFTAGVTALGTITMMAYLTDLMLLFPPLGPSAFILFHTPLAETASPRNVVLAHTLALLAGLGSVALMGSISPDAAVDPAAGLNWANVAAIALAMGLSGMAMITLGCVHPPAAATALIAAMGFLNNMAQISGVLIAVIILVLEAVFFNRILGGLPYPLWRFDPYVINDHPSLAGLPRHGQTSWQKMVTKMFHRR